MMHTGERSLKPHTTNLVDCQEREGFSNEPQRLGARTAGVFKTVERTGTRWDYGFRISDATLGGYDGDEQDHRRRGLLRWKMRW